MKIKEIEKGIPYEGKGKDYTLLYKALERMGIGDSFIVDPGKDYKISGLKAAIARYNKKASLGKRWVSKQIGPELRIWRIS